MALKPLGLPAKASGLHLLKELVYLGYVFSGNGGGGHDAVYGLTRIGQHWVVTLCTGPLPRRHPPRRDTDLVDVRLPGRAEGPRLLLRRWTPDDLDMLAATVERNLEHLRPWMAWVKTEPLPPEERRALMWRWEREWHEGGDVVLAVLQGPEIVGGAGLHRRRGPHGLEIGYWVDQDHLGHGIGTEIAAVLTTAAFSSPGITIVEIHHDKANVRSKRIPERLGYRFLGETPDQAEAPAEIGIDCAWQITSDAWRDRLPALQFA